MAQDEEPGLWYCHNSLTDIFVLLSTLKLLKDFNVW